MERLGTGVKGVEISLALGHSLAEAIAAATGKKLGHLASEEGWGKIELTMMLRGYRGRVYPARRDRLAEILGTTREVVDGWIAKETARAAEQKAAA